MLKELNKRLDIIRIRDKIRKVAKKMMLYGNKVRVGLSLLFIPGAFNVYAINKALKVRLWKEYLSNNLTEKELDQIISTGELPEKVKSLITNTRIGDSQLHEQHPYWENIKVPKEYL